jgi:hypothetical protein
VIRCQHCEEEIEDGARISCDVREDVKQHQYWSASVYIYADGSQEDIEYDSLDDTEDYDTFDQEVTNLYCPECGAEGVDFYALFELVDEEEEAEVEEHYRVLGAKSGKQYGDVQPTVEAAIAYAASISQTVYIVNEDREVVYAKPGCGEAGHVSYNAAMEKEARASGGGEMKKTKSSSSSEGEELAGLLAGVE